MHTYYDAMLLLGGTVLVLCLGGGDVPEAYRGRYPGARVASKHMRADSQREACT